jgi:hypothetical protein
MIYYNIIIYKYYNITMSNTNNNIFTQNVEVTFTVILAIIYASTIYIICGIFVTHQLDNHVFNYKEKNFIKEEVDSISLTQLIINIVITFSVITVVAYFIRSVVELIPFPFHNNNMDYHNVKREVYTGSLLVIILIAFSQTLNNQYKKIKYKLTGELY